MKKNNKVLLLVSLLLINYLTINAQRVDSCFIHFPQKILPYISYKEKLELLELCKAKTNDSIQNNFNGYCQITELDTINNFLSFRNEQNYKIEMQLFVFQNEKPFIGIIQTLCSPVCHSIIRFYNTDWEEIKMNCPIPETKQWFDFSKNESLNPETWYQDILKNNFVSLHFIPKSKQISITNNILSFVNEEEMNKIKPFYIDKPIILSFHKREWQSIK